MINSLSFQVRLRNWLFQDIDFPRILKKSQVKFLGVKQKTTQIFRGNQEKLTKILQWSWFLVSKFPGGVTQLCWISRVEAMFYPEFPREK